jgi:hypothetical protein
MNDRHYQILNLKLELNQLDNAWKERVQKEFSYIDRRRVVEFDEQALSIHRNQTILSSILIIILIYLPLSWSGRLDSLNGFSQVLLWLGVGLLFFVLPVLYKYKGYKALWAKRQAAEAEYLAQRQALLDQIKTLEQQG